MNKLNITNNGGINITLNDLRFLQDAVLNTGKALALMSTSSCIIAGIIIIDSGANWIISSGLISYGGELYYFNGGTYPKSSFTNAYIIPRTQPSSNPLAIARLRDGGTANVWIEDDVYISANQPLGPDGPIGFQLISGGRILYDNTLLHNIGRKDWTNFMPGQFEPDFGVDVNERLCYKRHGDLISLVGQFGVADWHSTPKNIIRMPVGFRPYATKVFQCLVQANKIGTMEVRPDGWVVFRADLLSLNDEDKVQINTTFSAV